jgi:tRNA 2-thiocytidine biosynthesis protein TtcA
MLREWERKFPGRLDSIFNAMRKVEPTHLLDRTLQDFAAVRATGHPEPEGDIAFDVDPLLEAAADAIAGAVPEAARVIPLTPEK